MGEIRNLDQLFSEIITRVGKKPTDNFYETWEKIMSRDMGVPFNVALKAWDQIQVEFKVWDFFELKIWNDKIDYLIDRLEADKPKEPQQSRSEVSKEERKVWKDNLYALYSGEKTPAEYLDTAQKTGQMTKDEVMAEIEKYARPGIDLHWLPQRGLTDINKPIKATLKARV